MLWPQRGGERHAVVEAMGGVGIRDGGAGVPRPGGGDGGTHVGAANSTTCPLSAAKKASKPVEITMWHWMPRENEATLQKLTDAFNSSQSDVKVKLVNQIDWEATFQKYKAGLSTGDLPDIVQLQESDQQRDGRHPDRGPGQRARQGRQVQLLRLSAPGDQLLHDPGHAVRDAVQRVGPRPLLQQEGVQRRGARSRANPRRRSTTCGPRPRSSRPTAVSAPLGLKTDPHLLRAMDRPGEPALREPGQWP